MAPALHYDSTAMITVGGLLLGAVLTASPTAGAPAPADPFAPPIAHAPSARGDAALGLRDPFAPDPRPRLAARRRGPRPSEADLRNPFDAAPGRRAASPRSGHAAADLRPPFERHAARRSTSAPARSERAPTRAVSPELRDPFRR